MTPKVYELWEPPLAGDSEDLIPLIASVGKARFALLGDPPHGTHEYYAWRGHRATVVVYHPERERAGTWVPT
jgi:erythromycin esterase-like protein